MSRSGDTGELIVDVSVPQDTIEHHNKDQLSNTDARIEAVEKSISELHERVTKETEIRQEQSEVVTLIAKNAAATELIKLAVNRLNGFFASNLQSEASTEANLEYSDDESAKACEKKADSETQRATELEAVFSISCVADEESAGVRRQLRTDAMCADARKIFATTKKDLEQGIAGVQEARWTQSQDLDLDDNSIAENTQIGYPFHADPDVPVIMQRQFAAVQVVPRTVELPQTLLIDSVEDIPVMQQSLLPTAQTVQKTEEIPQVRHIDKVVDVPVVWQRQAPTIQTEQKTKDVSQTQRLDRLVDVPFVTQQQLPSSQKVPKTFETPQLQFIDRTVVVPAAIQKRVPTIQTARKPVDVLQVQYNDKVVEVPVVTQRPAPIFETVQKTTEVPQRIDKAVDVPGLMQRQIPMIQKAEMTAENPQFQSINSVVDVPVKVRRQVPLVQRVQKVVEVPHIQFIDKVVDAPASCSGNGACGVHACDRVHRVSNSSD